MYPTTAFPAVDPSTRLALSNLRAHLVAEGDFSQQAVDAIIKHVAAEGTIYDAPYVYPAEVDVLTEVYVRGFEPVPYDDPAWGHLDDDEPFSADAPDAHVTTRPGYWEALEDAGIGRMPAVSGGSPDDIPPPFEPSPEDWEDYRAWSEAADRLDAFNDQRVD